MSRHQSFFHFYCEAWRGRIFFNLRCGKLQQTGRLTRIFGNIPENIDLPRSLNLSSASGKPEDTVLEAENFEEPVLHDCKFRKHHRFSINGLGSWHLSRKCGSCELKNNRISGCTQGVLFECPSNNTLRAIISQTIRKGSG